jgi:ABC-2 type transport system ATP-binding protein
MEEAEYCDRMLIMSQGSTLAVGTPPKIRALALSEENRQPTIEDAFIALAEGSTASPRKTDRMSV